MGCVQGTGTTTTTAAAGPSSPARTTATGDIEAPEVFQATDSALWDGRPSLGGIWVAAPDVQDPERVVMFNPATGKTVQGALFRRERDNPGPRLQISSDAAEALGILAGQPVEIRVTALRRAEPAPAPEAVVPAADAAVAAVEGTEATAAAAEPKADGDAAATAAAATAALAATGAAAVDAAGAATDVATDAAAAGADLATPEATVAEPPKRKTWKERRAEAKAAREAKKAAAAAAAAGVATEVTAPEGTEVPATAEGVAVEAVAVTALEDAPLDARSAEAPAAADPAAAEVVAAEPAIEPVVEPPKTRRQRRAEEAAAKAAAEAAAAAAAAAPPAEAAAPAGRAIQVASFTKEANADRAVEALAKIGITGQTRKTETNGKVVWGVVTTGDEAQLKAIKGFGFADAFFLQ